MRTLSVSAKPANVSTNLVTALFYLAGFLLLGLMLLYVFRGFGIRALVEKLFFSNYWAIPLLCTASLMSSRNRNGWWWGMTLGGYFLKMGTSAVGEPIMQLIEGRASLRDFDLPVVLRFLFGLIAIFLLTRQSVLSTFFKPPYDSFAPNRLRIIIAIGFSIALMQIVFNFVVFPMLSVDAASFQGALNLTILFSEFIESLKPNWLDVVNFYPGIALFPLGIQMLRKRKWSYYFVLGFWTILVVVSLNSFVTSFMPWLSVLESFFYYQTLSVLNLFAGILFVWWLTSPIVLTHFKFAETTRRPKLIVAISVAVAFGLLTIVANVIDPPILRNVFWL